MIKAMLFDADGMVINKPKRFSELLAEDYKVPNEKIIPFFQNEFQACLIGKIDLKDAVTPYLANWNWNGSVDDILKYWFEKENYVDKRITDLIANCRKQGIKCYLHSNQEKYRTKFMTDVMGFSKIFDDIFSSAHLGFKKPDPEFWKSVLNKISPTEKSEVLVFDDDEENFVSAKEFGFKSYLYKDFEGFIDILINLGVNLN